jgi:exonuclease-1
MLQHFGVIPFLVFDGDYLPSKAATEADRSKRRKESKRIGMDLLNAGKAAQAYLELQKAIDVTPEMARQLIDELKRTGVQYIVAPYEADAQMVYLERKHIIQGILSEDSDLLVFGAKCLLTKLDQYGECIEINQADFSACRDITLTGWSDREFRQMAILSGCDYLASINNMGLKTAYRMVRKHKTIEKVIRMLSFDGKYHVPKGYLEAFYQAELTFLHQRVYCPISNKLVYHTEPDEPLEEEKTLFIGAYVEPAVAMKVALGDLNPMTKEPILVGNQNHDHGGVFTPRAALRPQARRAVTQDDLKKGVSIAQFFKPNRTPLGELDINCFTPSPSQQDALRRNSGPWQASPVLPRPYLQRSSTTSIQTPQSAPQSIRSQVGRTLPWSASVSASRPQKRARLCEDNATNELPSGQSETLGRSRFFDSPTANQSPSIPRSKASRPKKEEVNIFSDDSIEEAMLELPDYDGWQKPKEKRSKIAIFEEVEHDSAERLATTGVFDDRNLEDTARSQTTIPNLTQTTSAASELEAPPTPVEVTIPQSIDLKSRFAFTPVVTPKQNSISSLPTPPSSLKPSRIPIPTKSSTITLTATKAPKPRILTPLESLGKKALNRPNVLASPPYTPTTTTMKRKFLKDKAGVPFPEVARPSALKAVLAPADIPLPAADEAENISLAAEADFAASHGSEDLIVHDSEEEDELISPSEGEARATSLNLDRFAFRA